MNPEQLVSDLDAVIAYVKRAPTDDTAYRDRLVHDLEHGDRGAIRNVCGTIASRHRSTAGPDVWQAARRLHLALCRTKRFALLELLYAQRAKDGAA